MGEVGRQATRAADAADDATDSRGFVLAARAGYVAAGLLHVMIGVIALRVATGGDCLNVREGPSTEAAAVRCYVDDVLLFERETAETPPEGWVAVRTPDGREGFASAEFLVR